MFAALSLLICSLVIAESRHLRDDDPTVDALKEVIYETNVYLVQKKLDVVDIPAIGYDKFFNKFEITGGNVGNFSTAELVGTPFMNETDLPDGSSTYYFDMDIGLTKFNIQANYNIEIIEVFSTSGTVNIDNTGNVVNAKGSIISKGSDCRVELSSVKIKTVGSIDLSIMPSSIAHSILDLISNIVLRIAAPWASGIINNTIKEVSEKDEVKQILTTTMCRYF